MGICDPSNLGVAVTFSRCSWKRLRDPAQDEFRRHSCADHPAWILSNGVAVYLSAHPTTRGSRRTVKSAFRLFLLSRFPSAFMR